MNKVILSGNLTRDPECGTTKSGVAYCRFGIAVQKRFKDANGERGVDFFNCVAWRSTAEYCSKYLEKGKKVTVCGELTTNVYEASDGAKRQSVDIVIDEVEIAYTKASESEQREERGKANMTPVDEDDLPF